MAEIDPPYTAPVYNPRRNANEMVGASPKVKGMKTAIVIVAVKPGRAPKIIPTRTPINDEKNIIGFAK
jgi:hypothetical protein